MELSVIIPVYNEDRRLQKPLEQIYKYLSKNFTSWELVAVNDGSKDTTKALLQVFAKTHKRMKIVSYSKNKGKGYAIAKGVKQAKGRYVFFMDIDLSVKPRELKRAIATLRKEKCDIIIGSRRLERSIITRHQPRLRETMGHVYTILTTFILGLTLTDLTCGFKGFRRGVAQEVFNKLTATRWSFDAEVLYRAHKQGYSIVEIPVTWEHVGNSKVNIGMDAVKSFAEVVKIRMSKV